MRTASKICTVYLFLESFFVSFDQSVLLHRRCLMLKSSETLVLVCRKIFSACYVILHETFSNSYGFLVMQEFNSFYPHLVLYDRKHFCSILTDLRETLPFAKLWSEECSYITVSKNAEAAICKCFSKYSQENICVEVPF